MAFNENEDYVEDQSSFSDSEFQELVCKYKFYSNIYYTDIFREQTRSLRFRSGLYDLHTWEAISSPIEFYVRS